MSTIEWVEVHGAVVRLTHDWAIPQSTAAEIVRNVLDASKVQVRGLRRSQLAFSIITERVAATLYPNSLVSREWDQIEIDWDGLVEQGRKLLPSWIYVADLAATGKESSSNKSKPRPRSSAKAKLKKPKRGPTPGTTGYQDLDRKLFPQIKELKKRGKARSAYGAALMLANEIAGGGSAENKARRVSALYRKRPAEGC
jgi:hypothetical protein